MHIRRGDDMNSEYTKNMTHDEVTRLRENVKEMSREKLERFRNSFEEDEQGFYGKECMDGNNQ